MAADGLANDVIAARLDTSPQVVHRWRKRFCDKGSAGLGDNLRSGRPVTFGPSVAVEAKQLACELRPSAACRCLWTRRGRTRLRLVHCPIHSSWLNQVEIYFSIIQRKVLTPTTSRTWPMSSNA
jgi:transposase